MSLAGEQLHIMNIKCCGTVEHLQPGRSPAAAVLSLLRGHKREQPCVHRPILLVCQRPLPPRAAHHLRGQVMSVLHHLHHIKIKVNRICRPDLSGCVVWWDSLNILKGFVISSISSVGDGT